MKIMFSLVFLPCVLSLALLGCATKVSTQYVPQNPGRLRLTIKEGRLGYGKHQAFSQFGARDVRRRGLEMAEISGCNKTVEENAKKAKGLFNRARAARGFGAMLPPLGLFLVPIGIKRQHQAMSSVIDTMNMHNDTPECIAPLFPPTVHMDQTNPKIAGGFADMATLKKARAEGLISDADFQKGQQDIRRRRQEDIENARASYDRNDLSRQEYKQKIIDIRLQYEGRR